MFTAQDLNSWLGKHTFIFGDETGSLAKGNLGKHLAQPGVAPAPGLIVFITKPKPAMCLRDQDLRVSKCQEAVNSFPRAVYQITPASKNGSFLSVSVPVQRAFLQPAAGLARSPLLSLNNPKELRLH